MNDRAHTAALDLPWPVTDPFRMRPGLSRLGDAPQVFLRDALAPTYAAHKRAVLQGAASDGLVGSADPAVLQAISDAYAAQTGIALPPSAQALAEGMQEDFVILHDEPDAMRTRFLSVCFPSNWNPAEKIGLDFASIHAPVADNALLQAGGPGIIDLAFRQTCMLRHVWLLSPNGDLAQHPKRRSTHWEAALAHADASHTPLIDRVYFRVERQTTLPLPALQRGVFFIRVMVAPLREVLAVAPQRPQQLHDALRSMSEAVVAYRGMASVRERLCAELLSG